MHELAARWCKKEKGDEWSGRFHKDDHHEASVETFYGIEREKDGSVERQRPRQTRKGSVSIAQTLLWPPIASPRFNMLTLRWIGKRGKDGEREDEGGRAKKKS